MLEVNVLARRVVRIIGVAISLLHPHRLQRELLLTLHIVRIEFLGSNVIIRIRKADVLRLLLSLGLESVFMALVEDVPGAQSRDHQRHYQRQLYSLLRLWTHHAETLSDRQLGSQQPARVRNRHAKLRRITDCWKRLPIWRR